MKSGEELFSIALSVSSKFVTSTVCVTLFPELGLGAGRMYPIVVLKIVKYVVFSAQVKIDFSSELFFKANCTRQKIINRTTTKY